LSSYHGQEINDHLVEILMQNALEEAEPEPNGRNMAVPKLTEWLGLT
jgi:hypothetical protein